MRISYSGRNGAYSGDFGGYCPVQGYGSVQRPRDEEPLAWYFRARGDAWELCVGKGEEDSQYVSTEETIWETGGPFGKWPDAGWMNDEEVILRIQTALNEFLAT